MLSKTVRWGLGIVSILLILQYYSPTAFADTILEIPRSDARLFCANDLSSVAMIPSNIESSLSPLSIDKPQASLNAELLFQLINDYRIQLGLSVFQKDSTICDIAKQRGPELDREVEMGTIHAGFYARNLPYWATENMKYGGNEQEMLNWWLNSPIHRHAIEGDFKFACGECYGKSCNQIFTSYIGK
ncbi:hypothetical protein KAZ66_01940 [Candidatus Woesebacteria bacterium]|nr:hypothetical protein [Candidatus Woesebacteria bacterium]